MNETKNTLSTVLILLPALSLLLLSCDKPHISETTTPGSFEQDSQAYSLPGFDPGAHQSPINIFTKRTKEENDDDQHQFVVHFQDEITGVENLGHTIQLDFKQGSTIFVGGITYTFKQIGSVILYR